MSSLPQLPPEDERERRLQQIKQEAAEKGFVGAQGIRPAGAPFPLTAPENGYYEMPLLKEPQWKWEVPVYLFVGGAAGAAAVIGAAANLVGNDRALAKDARWLAAAGGALSAPLLIADLGVPSRFLNMLRVFKLQSPMSVGAWTMTAFSSFSAATAFAGMMQERFGPSVPLQIMENAGEILSAATGLLFNNYTGVLLGATVVPAWNRNVGSLPIHFSISGAGAAVSLLELAGHDRSAALNALGIGAAALESLEGFMLEADTHEANRPLKRGPSGWTTRAGGVLSGPLPLALRLASLFASGENRRALRRNAALSSIAGSLLTRIGWVRAGYSSSRDYRIPLELPPAAANRLENSK
jgi:hypothetical protein